MPPCCAAQNLAFIRVLGLFLACGASLEYRGLRRSNTVPASLEYRACVARIPCLRRSNTVPFPSRLDLLAMTFTRLVYAIKKT